MTNPVQGMAVFDSSYDLAVELLSLIKAKVDTGSRPTFDDVASLASISAHLADILSSLDQDRVEHQEVACDS